MNDGNVYILAAKQGGVFSESQAEAAGVTPRMQQRRLEAGEFERVHATVLGIPGWPASTRRPLWLATLAVPGSAVARWSAAELHELRLAGRPGLATVVVPKASTRRIAGVKLHETRLLRPLDLTEVDGLPATTPARTMIDLAAEMGANRYFHAVDQAIQSGRLDYDDIAAAYTSLTKIGRPGIHLVEAYLRSRSTATPQEVSELEYRFDQVVAKACLPRPVAQFQPPWYDGWRGVVDRAWPDQKLLVELDGRSFHATVQAMADDRKRDRLAQRHGWTALRYTFAEVTRRSSEIVDELRSFLEHPKARAA